MNTTKRFDKTAQGVYAQERRRVSMQSAKRTTALIVLALGTVATMPSCATVTGTVTGAFTGAVDAPTQVYRNKRALFDADPIYWPLNILVVAPVGMLFGPLVGFAKGVALDVECMQEKLSCADVFGGYGPASIWRPYTIHW